MSQYLQKITHTLEKRIGYRIDIKYFQFLNSICIYILEDDNYNYVKITESAYKSFMEIERDEYILESNDTKSPDNDTFTKYISERVADVRISWYKFAIYASKYRFVNPANTVIVEIPDEWFLIKNIWKNRYYKCDQLDGVADCLNHIFNSNSSLHESKDLEYTKMEELSEYLQEFFDEFDIKNSKDGESLSWYIGSNPGTQLINNQHISITNIPKELRYIIHERLRNIKPQLQKRIGSEIFLNLETSMISIYLINKI